MEACGLAVAGLRRAPATGGDQRRLLVLFVYGAAVGADAVRTIAPALGPIGSAPRRSARSCYNPGSAPRIERRPSSTLRSDGL